MKKSGIVLLFLVVSFECLAQKKELKIDKYVLSVDTLSQTGIVVNTSGKDIVVLVEEGTIGLRHHKLTHGFSRHITCESNMGIDSVYKISYHDNLRKNLYKDFYYKENKLVLAKIELRKREDKVLYAAKFYFQNDSLINQSTTINKVWNKKRYRVNVDPLQDGYSNLTSFLERRNAERQLQKK